MGFEFDDRIKEREVRLFPSLRISSLSELEGRATASLLAMFRAVSEFGRAFVKQAGGPVGSLSCYTEVSFTREEPDGSVELRPDGVIRVVRGKTEWKALLEAKVGENPLVQEQCDAYHRLAKDEGFDALITVSNQAALPNGLPPQWRIDRRRLRSVSVSHFSWERLLSEAQFLSQRKLVEDEDQFWMLNEWIRYVTDPRSKIIESSHLGEHWNEVLRAAREGNLSAAPKQLESVVRLWDGFLTKTELRLRAKLGVSVQKRIGRTERRDPDARLKRLYSEALRDGCLAGEFRIPDAAGDVTVRLNFSAKAVRFGIDLDPPAEGRAKTRVGWLIRQLRGSEVPSDLLIKIAWDQSRLRSQARAEDALAGIDALLRDDRGIAIPSQSLPQSFSLEWTKSLRKSRGRSSAAVLEGIGEDLEDFYRRVVTGLRPFVPRAPQLPAEKVEPANAQSVMVQPDAAVPVPKKEGTEETGVPIVSVTEPDGDDTSGT